MKSLNQRGSTFVVLIFGLIVVVVVAVVGYRIVNTTDTGTISSSPIESSSVPKTVDSAADIKQADEALDGTAIDSGINPDQLDSELNSLL
ncbi:MAG: hypothetical protein AAB462_02580 [Patescibacteria group bacterium]